MNNQQVWWVLNSITIIVFDVVFFLLVSDVSKPIWISLLFMHIAYASIFLFSARLRKKRDHVVLGYPVIYLSIIYFIMTLFVTLTVAFIGLDSIKMIFVVHFILLGVYMFLLLSNIHMNQHTAAHSKLEQKGISFIKTTIAKLEHHHRANPSMEIKNKIEYAIELLRFAQTKSISKTEGLEFAIEAEISRLSLKDNETEWLFKLNQIENMIYERESILKSI